jgi:hypothetical protein
VTVLLEGVHPEEYHRALKQLDAARAKVDQLERDVDCWMGRTKEAMEKLQEALALAKRFKAERDEMPRCVGCGRPTSVVCAEDGKPRCLRADCDAMRAANAAAAPSGAPRCPGCPHKPHLGPCFCLENGGPCRCFRSSLKSAEQPTPWKGYALCRGECGRALREEERAKGNLCEDCATK